MANIDWHNVFIGLIVLLCVVLAVPILMWFGAGLIVSYQEYSALLVDCWQNGKECFRQW